MSLMEYVNMVSHGLKGGNDRKKKNERNTFSISINHSYNKNIITFYIDSNTL